MFGTTTGCDTDPKLSNNYHKGRHAEADKLKADQRDAGTSGVRPVHDESATCHFRARSSVNANTAASFLVE